VNIPTKELRGFVEKDEESPKTVQYPGLLYARDPSLDPQLVWKGKDEQDRKPLEVPAVPVYIQEKIHPQAIVEQVRAEARKETPGQPDLFGDFNNIKFDDMVDFYRHEQNWSNRMILGDSLLVMTSLAEKEGLKGKVQMIYIDPPYGIKFGSNWQVSTRKRDVKDGKAEDLTRQPEQVKAFRDTWELGIHSYLSYLRDRLVVARELLSESGSVFVQIGDENVHLVRSLMDEVFGGESFCGQITFFKTTSQTSKLVASSTDFLLWYAKSIDNVKYRTPYREKTIEEDKAGVYNWIEFVDGDRRRMTADEKTNLGPDGTRVFRLDTMTSQSGGETTRFDVALEGAECSSGKGFWKTNKEGMRRLVVARRLTPSGTTLAYIRYIDDFPAYPFANLWTDTGTGSFTDEKVYVVQTGTKVIARCLLMTTDPGDLVLDPTCGGGTTAYVSEHWGRRWITIDTSRVALALARTRLMAAKFPSYTLADSREGAEKEAEIAPHPIPLPTAEREKKWDGDIRKGFVYRRVPHVTLKSIANNEEIDAIHAKWQPQLEKLLSDLNRILPSAVSRKPSALKEWEVPREAPADWADKAKKLHAEWWKLRRERQKEIDDSISRRADTEFLYDKPYEDNKRIRVTGPFTVESLSPHRVLPAVVGAASQPRQDRGKDAPPTEQDRTGQFTTMILENLRKAGVQNTFKNERLKFDRLETFAGVWLHAHGDYTERDGKPRRVVVSIGPEHGTVGPEQVKEAAKEAVQGIGFDLLIVCGFAFDPHVSEEIKRYGKLTVLPCRMNPDLTMGDELLKKTGAGNLFMVFGEPDVKLSKKDGKVMVEILGLDVYDPTTGQIRSNSTDDIACWFIDTDYNGESFFVRHAYFTGSGEPYERLRRALRAEINEAAWQALYSTKSLPFDPPKTGKIAVKVINHYGDEVLKVIRTA
jgi:adenine-specific DNA-methyltransferase